MGKFLGITFGLLLLAFLISACGGDTDTPTPVPSTSTPVPQATATSRPQPTATPTAVPPSPTPTVKQELRVNLGAEPSSLDPQLATGLHEFSVIRQVFQGLLGFNQDLSLRAVVASEIPTVENGGISPDGLTYTFKLRSDATWSDGQPVTAGDFAFAIARALDPDVASPNAQFFFSIRGAAEYNGTSKADAATKATLRDALGIEAIGPSASALRITLGMPDPTFLQKAALSPAYPVRQDVIEEHGDGWTEAGSYIGNGPYVMTEWAHQDHITIEINPNYWGPKPLLTKITYKMMGDPNSEFAAYRNGELEIAQVPPGTEASVAADASLAAQLVRAPQLFTFGIFFNNASAPFDDVSVRQAFATAIDRSAWTDKVKGGVGEPATGWLPPGIPGYERDAGLEYRFDKAKAQALLGAAGFPGGEGFPGVRYTFVAVGEQGLLADFLEAQLEDNLGIEITQDPLDPPAFFQQVLGARQFQIVGLGWSADYPDPESFLAPLFMSGIPNNFGQYSNPEFDDLAGRAFMELDQNARIDLWTRAHRTLVQDVPVVPFFHGERFFLKKPALQGLVITPIDGAIPGDLSLAGAFLTR